MAYSTLQMLSYAQYKIMSKVFSSIVKEIKVNLKYDQSRIIVT